MPNLADSEEDKPAADVGKERFVRLRAGCGIVMLILFGWLPLTFAVGRAIKAFFREYMEAIKWEYAGFFLHVKRLFLAVMTGKFNRP